MKKMFILGGTIIALFIALNLTTTVAKKPEVHENTTTVANKVIKQGSGWYVNDDFLDKSFKHGFSNLRMGDSLNLMLDSEGRVVGWKVNN